MFKINPRCKDETFIKYYGYRNVRGQGCGISYLQPREEGSFIRNLFWEIFADVTAAALIGRDVLRTKVSFLAKLGTSMFRADSFSGQVL